MIDKATISTPKTHYGAGKPATRLFILQRLTGALNIAFLIFFVWFVVSLAGADRAQFITTVRNPGIAVILFLSGKQRYASETARFMIHKSHATASPGSRPDAPNIIVEGLRADDARTESILRKHVELTPEQWGIHQYGDLHLNARDAKAAGLIDDVRDFAPPKGAYLRNI